MYSCDNRKKITLINRIFQNYCIFAASSSEDRRDALSLKRESKPRPSMWHPIGCYFLFS